MSNLEFENKTKPEEFEVKATNQKEKGATRPFSVEQLRDKVSYTDAQITQSQNRVEETRQGINEVRTSLGLPDTGELPHSIAASNEHLASLQKQKAAAEAALAGRQEGQTHAGDAIEKSKGEMARELAQNIVKEFSKTDLQACANRMFGNFRERDQNNYTELTFPNAVDNLREAWQKFMEEMESRDPDLDKINQAANSLSTHMDGIAEKPRGTGSINDDPESLARLKGALRSMSDALEHFASKIKGAEGQDDDMELSSITKRLKKSSEFLQEKSHQVAKLERILNEMGY